MSEESIAERYRVAVAEEVRVWLARRRMSGVKLAELTGRSQLYVSRRLRGEVPIDVEDLAVFADALGVTTLDLLPRVTAGYAGPDLHTQPTNPLAPRVLATAGQSRKRPGPPRPVDGRAVRIHPHGAGRPASRVAG